MGSRLNEIMDSSMAALVGIAIICTAVIPIGMRFINGLSEEFSEFVPLLTLVVFIAILGLVIGVLKTFQDNKR